MASHLLGQPGSTTAGLGPYLRAGHGPSLRGGCRRPYSPKTLDFWRALNDRQLELGGDPFIGAKLGNLLQAVGFHDVTTEVETFHLDNRCPGERAEFLAYWTELLLSAAPGLEEAGMTTPEVVEGMKEELALVGRDPNAVFFYSFVHARARVW